MTQKELETFIANAVGSEVAKLMADNKDKAMSLPPVNWWNDFQKALTSKDPEVASREPKGSMVGAAYWAYARSVMDKQPPEYGLKLLESRGGKFKDLAEKIGEARTKAMAANEPLSGGFLIPEEFSSEVIELLRPASVVRAFNPPTIPTTLGNLRVPRITDGTTGYYIGENSNITPSQIRLGQLALSYKKLAVLVPMSNDLLRRPSVGADALVRNDMVRGMAQAENIAFLRSPGTEAQPKGLRYWVDANNVFFANATVSLQNSASDLGKIILKLEENNIPLTRPGWIFAPRTKMYLMTVQTTTGAYAYRDEMIRGTLWGWPFKTSTQVPTNLTDRGGTNESEIYLVDWDEAIIGETERLIVDASAEAAYFDGASVVSSFSQDQTVIRSIAEHDFAMRRNTAVAVMNGVTWGA